LQIRNTNNTNKENNHLNYLSKTACPRGLLVTSIKAIQAFGKINVFIAINLAIFRKTVLSSMTSNAIFAWEGTIFGSVVRRHVFDADKLIIPYK